MARSSSPKHATARPAAREPLSSGDFARHLVEKAAEVAPSDVTALAARANAIRIRAASERDAHPDLVHRVHVALHLLSDHARGACPQIPYHTVALLAAALHYYVEPIDVIPDFIHR